MVKNYQLLFSSHNLNHKVVLPNRFVLSPITLNLCTKTGFITQAEINYALKRSHSACLQITSGAYINQAGKLFENGFGIDHDNKINGLKKLAQAIKANNAKAIIQLAHAGRFSQVFLKQNRFSYGVSSNHYHLPFEHDVIAMSEEQIQQTINDYAQATKRAILAGFDGIEISSAQKLLMQEFFSVFSNQRTDQWGSQNLVNRARFSLAVFEAVQKVIDQYAPKDFIFGYRATAEETRQAELGYSIDDFIWYLNQVLKVAKIDYLAIASWGKDVYLNKVRTKGQYYGKLVNQVIYDLFHQRLTIIANGGINDPTKAIEALKHADLIGVSTPFIIEPDFVTKIANDQLDLAQITLNEAKLKELAIPKKAFKNLAAYMEYSKSITQAQIDLLKKLTE
ncbi:Lipoylation-related NADH-dependent flavin oxidoreductase [[Mycoplasma] cavipharyngis]|uniref:oxidoreductase n=1 Tax=[Mycoplasma] cavipharyngis TaxID=92757 RepID=UPI0037041D6F